jgi:hypothetical protein
MDSAVLHGPRSYVLVLVQIVGVLISLIFFKRSSKLVCIVGTLGSTNYCTTAVLCARVEYDRYRSSVPGGST